MKVNNMTEKQAAKFLEDAFDIWSERSRYQWELDITLINDYWWIG
jgi:hypothetical protein